MVSIQRAAAKLLTLMAVVMVLLNRVAADSTTNSKRVSRSTVHHCTHQHVHAHTGIALRAYECVSYSLLLAAVSSNKCALSQSVLVVYKVLAASCNALVT
jgi:hypothetical protein